MEEVSALSLEVCVAFGHDLPLLLVVVRVIFFPLKVALGASKSFAFFAAVGTFDSVAIGIVGVLENPSVDTIDLLGSLRFFGRVFVHVDTERGGSLARGLLLDRNLFDGSVLWDVSVEVNRCLTDFAQPQDRPTTRNLEFEAGLVAGERPILPRRFLLEHLHGASVLFLCFDCGDLEEGDLAPKFS